MDTATALTAVFIVILILLIYTWYDNDSSPTSEHFDTYQNHDFGAAEVYGMKDVDDAALRARYTWKEKDPDGLSVYDKYYETHLGELNYQDSYNDYAPFDSATFPIDKHPGIIFNEQIVTLAQKNY